MSVVPMVPPKLAPGEKSAKSHCTICLVIPVRPPWCYRLLSLRFLWLRDRRFAVFAVSSGATIVEARRC
jgi:hypothetical protein